MWAIEMQSDSFKSNKFINVSLDEFDIFDKTYTVINAFNT